VNANDITAMESNATYQWVDCNNANSMISGETAQTFTATVNGSYAVEITLNGCIDTSACVMINTVGINSLSSGTFNIHPNPANENITVEAPANSLICVTNFLGQQVIELKASENQTKLNISTLAKGVYFVSVRSESQTITKRLIVE
jgi:hypothetical protein